MRHRIVILGAGTGGTLTANRLHKVYGDSAEIIVVDRDDRHVYQPGLLFVPFGLADPEEIVRARHAQIHDGIEFRIAEVDRVETVENIVHLAGGDDPAVRRARRRHRCVAAAGGDRGSDRSRLGRDGVHLLHPRGGDRPSRRVTAAFRRGRLVVNLIDLPIKCPVAPLEFCFLADWYLRERGVRAGRELVYATPLDGAFTKPLPLRGCPVMLDDKGIALETEFATGRVDGKAGTLISWDEREVPFDLLVTIPLHGGAAFVSRSPGLGDELGFVATDSTRSRARPLRTCSRSATRPTSPTPRPAPTRTSRARR